MTKGVIGLVCSAAAATVLSAGAVGATEFSAKFSGFQEVGALNNETGAILSNGTATLDLDLDRANQTLTFKLTYSGLQNVLQSHIHFGKLHVPGNIMVFFCTNLGNGPTGTPTCPTSSGTVTGTIHASDVQAIPGQNVTAGDFDAVADALESNTAYGNIHTNQFKAGEIRGQIRRNEGTED